MPVERNNRPKSKKSSHHPGGDRPNREPAPPPSTERVIDESVDESFPASDPPAHSSRRDRPSEDEDRN